MANQQESEPTAAPMVQVADLPNGHTLFRQANGVGGFRYWSSEITGVMVWDTCIVDASTILAALTEESRRVVAERKG